MGYLFLTAHKFKLFDGMVAPQLEATKPGNQPPDVSRFDTSLFC